jgi:chromate reductase
VKLLGIAGSLRRASYNRMALEAARSPPHQSAMLELLGLEGIPVSDQEQEDTLPPRVAELKRAIRASDAVLFCTPEYNYSLPGGLKHAIDWVSRPPGDNAWKGKPAAIMGAAIGMLGSARAQYHLRQCLVAFDMPVVNQPEVMIGAAASKFDASGRLTDEAAARLVAQLLAKLVALAKLHAARAAAGSLEPGVLVRVGRRAATEEAQRLARRDRVPRARRDQDRVARTDLARLAVDLHRAAALDDEVELLGAAVVVALRRGARRQRRLGQALVEHRRVRAVEQAADGRAVPGGEGRLVGERADDHGVGSTLRCPDYTAAAVESCG